jgi:hypothetical protein
MLLVLVLPAERRVSARAVKLQVSPLVVQRAEHKFPVHASLISLLPLERQVSAPIVQLQVSPLVVRRAEHKFPVHASPVSLLPTEQQVSARAAQFQVLLLVAPLAEREFPVQPSLVVEILVERLLYRDSDQLVGSGAHLAAPLRGLHLEPCPVAVEPAFLVAVSFAPIASPLLENQGSHVLLPGNRVQCDHLVSPISVECRFQHPREHLVD